MKKYSYARLSALSFKGVMIETTDQELINWVSAELKMRFPRCEIYSLAGESQFKITNGCIFSKLDNQDMQAGWWILSMMLQKGWEPFNRVDNYEGLPLIRKVNIDLKLELSD